MDSDKQTAAAGAPGTIELGGQTYLVGQATDADMMAVRARLKKHVKRPLQMYADLVNDPLYRRLPKEVKKELAKEAGQLHGQGQVSLTPEMATDMLMEPAHCAFLAWMLVRKHKPDVKLEDLVPHITEDNAPAVFFELQAASGMDQLGN